MPNSGCIQTYTHIHTLINGEREESREKRDDELFEKKNKTKNKGSRGVGIFHSNGSADGRIVYRGVFGGEYFKSGNSKAYLTDEQKLHQVEYFSD